MSLLCAGVTCLPLFFGAGEYVGNGTDLPWVHVPLREWMREAVRSGQWPLWNPHLFNGYPAWVFRPPWSASHLLWYVGSDPRWVLPCHILLHLAWLHLGAQVWLRSRGTSFTGSVLGAQTLMLSGFVLGHLYAGHVDIIEALAWGPWVLFAFERYHSRPSPGRLLLASATIGLMLATGHFHVAYLVLWTGVLYNAARLGGGEWSVSGGMRRYLLQVGHIAVTSAALSCFYLVSMAQTVPWFNRASGGFDLTVQPVSSWLTWLVPDLMNLHSTPLNWSLYPLWECHAYMGVLAPVLLVAAGIAPDRKASLAFVAFALLLALGPPIGLYNAYAHLDPVLRFFRVPSRFLLPALLALSALLAESWDRPQQRRRALGLALLCWGGAAALTNWGAWIALVDGLSAGKALGVFQANRFPDSLEDMRRMTALRLVGQGVLFAAGAWLCLRRSRLSRRWALLGLLGLTSLDGARVAYPYWTQRAQRTQLPSEWVQLLREQPLYRGVVDPAVTSTDWGPASSVAQVDGYEISALGAYSSGSRASTGTPDDAGVVFHLFGVNRFTDHLSLRYFLTNRGPEQHDPQLAGLTPLRRAGELWIYENPAALPRVQASHRLVPETALLRYDNLRYLMAHPEFPRGVASWRGAPLSLAPGILKVHDARLHLNSITLRVELTHPAVLMLSDAYVPGWSVRVDDHGRPLLVLNSGLARGVQVDAGTHLVEFTYSLPGLWWAGWVSLMTLSTLSILSLRTLRAAAV